MKIELTRIKVRELVEDYKDNAEEGVSTKIKNGVTKLIDGEEIEIVHANDILDIRPQYQREFIYDDKDSKAVIDTILKGFPLNVMYWVKNENGFEVLDGQQRTISICKYVKGNFYFNDKKFFGLPSDIQDKILDYELFVYICEGTDSEKLDWFKTINIAGKQLYPQELRNAVYHGEWLSSAKRFFSKPNCGAYNCGKEFISGKLNRQDYLETALSWIANYKNTTIEKYMSDHQKDADCTELKMYFQNVITWVQTLFPNHKKWSKVVKNVDWGLLYNKHHEKSFTPSDLESKVSRLMKDDDVQNKKGIFEYVLGGHERCLNIRTFTESEKTSAYERQEGICPLCGKHFSIEEMEGDHITPWVEGGKTNTDNLQMLCKECNRRKSKS